MYTCIPKYFVRSGERKGRVDYEKWDGICDGGFGDRGSNIIIKTIKI